MREILFRGKRMDNGRWACGDYHKFTCTTSGTIPTPTHYIMGTDAASKAQIWVDPVTIGQYTGRIDKNRKKIFEGDIVRFAEWSRGDACWVGSVTYDYGSMFVVRGGANKECETDFEIQLSRIDKKRTEVIGNIHDNPELISKEE